jgi:hypothetical protein
MKPDYVCPFFILAGEEKSTPEDKSKLNRCALGLITCRCAILYPEYLLTNSQGNLLKNTVSSYSTLLHLT